ncbi:MAG: recombination protein RecR [Gammaproteobacteria bacterium]|nr:recombination protein RecR [Gammaproteobacteria bacterium]MBQ0774173.1 recombination protein RecR [Gammaproteobacteria bacterium]|tara:strand:- start:96721 stop:97329 length:609 start_codon:yes stop_codon:yes gene_type:complete
MKHAPLVQDLINAFTCLPGVGARSAQRMSYWLLERNRQGGSRLATALSAAMEGVEHCPQCRNFAEQGLCPVCQDQRREQGLLCVVESPADVLAVEQSGEYRGRYFVLMGHLSPIDGIGPRDIGLDLLEQQISSGAVAEIILATSTTVEGEATAHYILDLTRNTDVSVSRIAQGVPMGGELEFVDGVTLAHALRGRQKVPPSF